ncbi:MAG TPA: GNAT family N-acetyltransferase [Blastocatellia bacterium]|nr:GNAT family N-acetyltransferase [Blastocatellia bacterium]
MSDGWPIIRPATEADADSAFKLMSELGYPGLSLPHFVKTYYALLEHPGMFLLVAEEEDHEVVAFASITSRPQLRLTGQLVTIDELVVADRARGQGVGRMILEAAEAMARKLGARRLELETNRARESYRRGFYVKNGFLEADSAVMRIDYPFDEKSQ